MNLHKVSDREIERLFQIARRNRRDTSTSTKEMGKEPLHTGGVKLDQLIDDVLLKILQDLELIDLCSLFYTSARFRPLVEQLLGRKCKQFEMISDIKWNFMEKRIILMTCGAHIETLLFGDSDDFEEKTSLNFESVMRYCTHLKVIQLNECFILMEEIPEEILKRFFGHLEEMYLTDGNCTFSTIPEFPFISNLRKFVVNAEETHFYGYSIGDILENNFHKNALQHLQLDNICELEPELFDVVNKFKCLRVLKITLVEDCWPEPNLGEWFATINDHLTELEVLTLDFMVYTSVESLLVFIRGARNLKKIQLRIYSKKFEDEIAKMKLDGVDIIISRKFDLKVIEFERSV